MNSNIVIENNFIKSVGNDIEGDEIECKGKIVIPGLVNSHTHLYSLRLRGTKEFYDFQIIESYEKFLEMGILEMLSFGITTFIDFGSDAKLLKSLSEKYGIRILGGYNEFKNLGDSEFFIKKIFYLKIHK
jgi:cytosine/adenosine deaminase-related metal-dependent hydrolase